MLLPRFSSRLGAARPLLRNMGLRNLASAIQDVGDWEDRVATYDVPESWIGSRPHVVRSMKDYAFLHKESLENPGVFWSKVAHEYVWKGDPPTSEHCLQYNFDRRQGEVFVRWFEGHRTNLAFNCLERQIDAGRADQIAMICERNDPDTSSSLQPDAYTFGELRDEVNRVANTLRGFGVQKGDRVAIFMANVPENCIAMLACARIGAVHSVVFGGFSREALAGRILDCDAKVVITQDGTMRGDKLVALKQIVDDAIPVVQAGGGQVDHTLVLRRLPESKECQRGLTMVPGRDHWWDEVVPTHSTDAVTEWVDAEDPLFILYTSGSTGAPKGIVHTTGGYLVGVGTSFKYVFDIDSSHITKDVFFCTADVGWITGHSCVTYGPLLDGVTQVVYEGVPTYPAPDRLWQICEKHGVSHLFTAPTLLRTLMGAGDQYLHNYSRDSLRHLGTVGEPINHDVWRWYFEQVGESRCPIVDTWWQTETGAFMITPQPIRGFTMKPGSASLPFFGVDPVILDHDGNELHGEAEGLLAVKGPWPSALRGIWGNQQRFEETYFSVPGYYMTGDGARRDQDGYYWITGRLDDVIIVSGHNIHTADVESAVVAHPLVAEAATVGIADSVKGQSLYVFVTLVDNAPEPTPELAREIKEAVRDQLGAFAAPDTIHWANCGLPKTRSGKIMRRVLRQIAAHGLAVSEEHLGDLSTLAEPSVVRKLVECAGPPK